ASLESLAVIRLSAAVSTNPCETLVVSSACWVVCAGVGTTGAVTTGAVTTGGVATRVGAVLAEAETARANNGVASRAMRFMKASRVRSKGVIGVIYGESASGCGRA